MGLLETLHKLQNGKDLAGIELRGTPPQFCVGSTIDTGAPGGLLTIDLETLKKKVFLAVLIVPVLDPPALETDAFPVEPRRDLEAARVVGDHRPGIAAVTTCPSHGLERRLAVGMAGVPVTGPAQSSRVEIFGSGAEGLGHLGAAEKAATGVPPTWSFATLQALHSGLQRIVAPTVDQLLDQRLQPMRRTFHEIAMGLVRAVEDLVSGAQ